MSPAAESRAETPVVDMTESPFCTLRPVAAVAVRLTDSFWEPRIRKNREVTIPSQLRHCESTGRIDNFRRASGKMGGEFQGIYFNDSDVYKWVEAASWSLATHPEAQLAADVAEVIAEIGAAQDTDGYLNTYFSARRPERFANLKDMHEIYCAGHLFQAAVANYRATGSSDLLNVARNLADLLYDKFGPGGVAGACGHEEAEMGLVELFRVTKDSRYLQLARMMIEVRGRQPSILGGSAYHQDHMPFTQQTEMIGHAVRHLYLCCGAADVVAETGDSAYLQALDRLWANFTQRKMYVTGGAGARWEGEAFGADYELPNTRAYTETCAAIGSVMWNWRMLQITGLPQFADVMEIALYNGVLPGLSLDGTCYFYQNPLADRGNHRREEWFGCACCPPNVARLLASLPGYFYSTTSEGIYVHLFADSTAEIPLADGNSIRIRQETNYPWDGEVIFHIESVHEDDLTLFLRIPFWADEEDTKLFINDADATERLEGEPGRYRAVRGRWRAGDRIRLVLPMPVEWVESHPWVLNNHGRVALQRGPLVYCVEQADHGECDVWDVTLPDDAEFALEPTDISGHKVVSLRTKALARDTDEWHEALYAPYRGPIEEGEREVKLTAIPYYAWANREAGPMAVWLPVMSSP